ncbi:Nn.00g055280.m01.CDS01 [Neocucurbitaria sp. VM-36]
MSRPSAAVRLLFISLPFALSLPQAIPPYQLLNATALSSSPTGVPEPAPVLDSGSGDGTLPDVTGETIDGLPFFPPTPIIAAPPVPFEGNDPTPFYGPPFPPVGPPVPIELGIGDDTGPEIFVDPLLPTDPVPDPFPTVTIPLDPILSDPNLGGPIDVIPPIFDVPPEAPTVSIKTFLSIIQPLLDLIGNLFDSVPGSDALVRPLTLEGSSLSVRQVFGSGSLWSFSKPVTNTFKPAVNPVTQAVNPVANTPSIEPTAEAVSENPVPAVSIFGDLVKLIKDYNFATSRGPTGGVVGKRDASSEASSDSLLKFYTALASSQESVEISEPLPATLQESFEGLDDDTKATVLNALEAESARLELAKREGQHPGLGGMQFINTYTDEFHYLYPVLQELRPEIAQGLQTILEDPTIPVPPMGSLDLDDLPDQLRQFVLDMYTFMSMLSDSAIPLADRLQFLKNLGDGMNLKKRQGAVDNNIIVNGPTWDDDRVQAMLNLYVTFSPVQQSLANEAIRQLTDPLYSPSSTQDVDLDHLGDSLKDQLKGATWESYQFMLLLQSLPMRKARQLLEIIMSIQDSQYRKMRRGLRIRQDEGPELDNAPKLGSELDYILGPEGTLDPLGQTDQSLGSQSDSSYDDQSAQSYDDQSEESYSDPYGNGSYDEGADDSYADPYADPSSNYDDSASNQEDAPAAQSEESNPSAAGGVTPDAAPVASTHQDSFQDYDPNNANLEGAYLSDITEYLENGDLEPDEEVPDLGEWSKYDPSFINDVVESDFGGQWNTGVSISSRAENECNVPNCYRAKSEYGRRMEKGNERSYKI